MNKVSYRDKVIILVVAILAIFLVAVLAFIKPKLAEISDDKANLATQQAEQQRIEDLIAKIPELESTIDGEYTDASTYSASFAQHRDNYQIDQFVQEYFVANSIAVTQLVVNPASSDVIEFYSYEPNVVTYPLFQAADINGDLEEALNDKIKTSTVFSQLETQEIETYSAEVTFSGKKDDIDKLLDAIEGVDENVIVSNVSIDDYTFNSTSTDATVRGTSTGTMLIQFYVLEPLEKPAY